LMCDKMTGIQVIEWAQGQEEKTVKANKASAVYSWLYCHEFTNDWIKGDMHELFCCRLAAIGGRWHWWD
jgi:hypothetical protein